MIDVPPAVLSFLENEAIGVLATTRRDGSTRQSVVNFVLHAGVVLITSTTDRFKAADIRRTGAGSLCVVGATAPRYVTLEGPARVRTTDIATDTEFLARKIFGDAIDARPMSAAMKLIYGDPPADRLTDESLAALGRVLIEIDPQRVYGSTVLFS